MQKYHSHIKNNHKSYLSIGTNLGNKVNNLHQSINFLKIDTKISLMKTSSIYNSEPLYYKKQPNFLNMVVQIHTVYNKHQLLEVCKKIEYKMGRNFSLKKNRHRIIDIDILTYDDCVYKDEILSIPHPRIKERKFVLLPFFEIAEQYILPDSKLTIRKILFNVKDNSKVCKFVN